MTLVERSGGSSSVSTDPSPRLNQLTFGGGSPTSRIHIRPGQAPTTDLEGIRFGTGAPLSLSSNNIWTGTNQFTQPVQFSNTVSVPDGGISFTAPGAAATRTALSLVPGTDLQAYDADLQTIAALTKPDGGMMVGDGTNWVLESGATLRTSLGLGTTSAVAFDTLTLAGQLSGTTASLSGQLQLPGATGGGGALLLGTTTELYESPAGTLRTPDNLRVDGSTQLGLDGTDPTTVMGRLWLGGGGDVSLERTGAGQMTLTGDLVVTGGMAFGGTLQTASGGTGRDLSGLAANRLLYTDGVESFGEGSNPSLPYVLIVRLLRIKFPTSYSESHNQAFTPLLLDFSILRRELVQPGIPSFETIVVSTGCSPVLPGTKKR